MKDQGANKIDSLVCSLNNLLSHGAGASFSALVQCRQLGDIVFIQSKVKQLPKSNAISMRCGKLDISI